MTSPLPGKTQPEETQPGETLGQGVLREWNERREIDHLGSREMSPEIIEWILSAQPQELKRSKDKARAMALRWILQGLVAEQSAKLGIQASALKLSGQHVMSGLRRALASAEYTHAELRRVMTLDQEEELSPVTDVARSLCAALAVSEQVSGACPACGHTTVHYIDDDHDSLTKVCLTAVTDPQGEPVALDAPVPGQHFYWQLDQLSTLWTDVPGPWTWVYCDDCDHGGWIVGFVAPSPVAPGR